MTGRTEIARILLPDQAVCELTVGDMTYRMKAHAKEGVSCELVLYQDSPPVVEAIHLVVDDEGNARMPETDG